MIIGIFVIGNDLINTKHICAKVFNKARHVHKTTRNTPHWVPLVLILLHSL